MTLSDDISRDVQTIITTQWNLRKGKIVPTTDNIALSGGSVELEATFLYADLADSSKIAKELDRRVAAKIMKSFLATATRVIKVRGGTIVSFDGDRVLGIFVGDTKNSNAAKCALQIKYVVTHIIRKKFESNYPLVRDASFTINHGIGVDTGTILIVRAGARGANDLISIGRAPNLAAKLSNIRVPDYQSFITERVYNRLSDESKYGGKDNKDMWERRSWKFLGESIIVYRSSWWWKP